VCPVLCNLESGAGANGCSKIAHTCRHAGAENVGFVERIAWTNVAAVASSRLAGPGPTRPDREVVVLTPVLTAHVAMCNGDSKGCKL
jgi:hypothetical protein